MAWNFFHEIGRKIIHLIILIVLVIFFAIKNQAGQQAALLFLVMLLTLFIVLEYFRLDLKFKLPLFHKLIRPKEEYRVYGVIFFLSSTIIALAVFDTPVALAALLMTTFGDMSAAIAGKKYGTTMLFRNKTVIGFATELITNLLVAIIISLSFSINIYIPITMAFAATITETLVDELDDNLAVPLVSGFIGQILALAI
ncbi:MAG: CTP--2,3-di-O-geranylgeranyl-sn-glycero-1-phosphate cytidyltransferase [Candidatus Woesearchaeota archaeon]|jgi:dolichol kinase|nr:CTP--2,3-di-O-geranylgeranyl-sn-glycero-1-phosphate cytidyltransferase [Candidatus Woesearchaeota archaeon]|tara:strand:+ start:225 stop:818 length:594 start_codon:yes stop_codon:yes gene_type:complete